MRRDTTLGKQLVEWRASRKLKQIILADYLGITRQRLSAWEHDGVPGPDKRLVRLAMRQLLTELGTGMVSF